MKLLRKEVVLADNASWLFRVSPYLIFAATWTAASLVPTFATGLPFSVSADLIAIVALLGSARFFLALVGLDVGTSFGGIGSSREVMIASLAEPALIIVAFTLALIAGSTQLSVIAAFMTSGDAGLRVSLGLALAALIIVAIAENARDAGRQSGHAPRTDDGARSDGARVFGPPPRGDRIRRLAEAAALRFADRGGIRAVGSRDARTRGRASTPSASSRIFAKVAVAGALLALFETTIAKMRVFRVPEFLGISLMLALLGALLMFVTRSL